MCRVSSVAERSLGMREALGSIPRLGSRFNGGGSLIGKALGCEPRRCPIIPGSSPQFISVRSFGKTNSDCFPKGQFDSASFVEDWCDGSLVQIQVIEDEGNSPKANSVSIDTGGPPDKRAGGIWPRGVAIKNLERCPSLI